MTWIVPHNWDKFQRYKDRDPAWIKLYLELERRDDWAQLTLAQRGLLVSIWIQYALRNGQLRASALPSLILQKVPRKSLEILVDAGFIRLCDQKPRQIVTDSRQKVTPSRAREETEEEKETPLPPLQGGKAKRRRTTGWRQVHGSHGVTLVPDLFGTDPPPKAGVPR